MKLNKGTICNSPFLGVYSLTTEDYCIVPKNILKKEEDFLKKNLQTKIIKTTVNQSSLIGVYLAGMKDKIIADKDTIKENEIEILEKEGIKVKTVSDYNALGNLLAINSNYGVASILLKKETISTMNKFFNVTIEQEAVAGTDVPGSALYVNEKLFVVNPNIKETEFDDYKKKFKVLGKAQTLNYGDLFVGNDILGNNFVTIVGQSTSTAELIKLDELIVEFNE
jgi:translation initiation factor 6